MKKFVLAIFVCLLMGICLFNFNTNTTNVSAASYNYGEALQKAIYFYECQATGVLPAWNRARGLWRGDAQLGCSVPGGWVDAGDNVKFGLPMAYSASMLGWALYEYGSAFTSSGQETALKNNLKWVCDYFVACDKGNSLVYQIGDGGADHSFWGPVEVTEKKKGVYPSYSCNASCVVGQTAAALAVGSIVLNNSTYLTHAKSLFTLADTVRSDATYTAANGFYNSWSGFWDELMWAATWLYIATGDNAYLTKAQSYFANLGKEGQSTEIAYKWAISWDDQHDASLFLLNRISPNPDYDRAVRNNLDWCTVGGPDGTKVRVTPGGLIYVDSWGACRYAANQAFLAFCYADWTTDATLKARYKTFAESQINYSLGSNPRNSSYLIGYGTNPPKRPHHRTAHGSWADSQTVPPNHRHTLYGGLVGGPDSSDGFSDDIAQYVYTEVACDYNAGFVGCLAKMYSLYGGNPLGSFPVQDTKDDEFFVEASVNSSGPNYTEIKALCNNRSGFPARFVKNLNFVYYMDLSEVIAAGASPSNITVSTNYVEFPVTTSPVTQLSGNIYYVKISFNDGASIYPGGQSEYAGEIQFRISAPTGTSYWNPSNDFSYTGLTSTVTKTSYIPVFDGTTLLYGSTPGPQPTPTTSVSPTATKTPTPTTSVTPTATKTPTPTVSVTPTVTKSPSGITPTVTKTPTATITPTASVIVTPTSNGGIKIQFYNQNRDATSNQIYANFQLVNTGSTAIALSTVKMRYYYTIDGAKPQNFWCDYSSVGSGNITNIFVTMPTPKTNADTYFEVGFTSAAGSIAPGASVPVQTRIAKNDWTNYTQTNDYSFNPTASNFVDWNKVTGYINGVLKWGIEP